MAADMDSIISLIWLFAALAILILFLVAWLIFIKPHRNSGPVPGRAWVLGQFDRKGIRTAYALRKHLNQLLDQTRGSKA